MIQYSNISYFQWIYDNFVLFSLSTIFTNAITFINQSTFILIIVFAFRDFLNCFLLFSDFIKIDSVSVMSNCLNCNNFVQINYAMNFFYDFCDQKYNNFTHSIWNQIYVVSNDSFRVYVEKDINFQWNTNFINDDDYVKSIENDDDFDVFNEYIDNYYFECSSFVFFFDAAFADEKTKKIDDDDKRIWNSYNNISIMYCYQRLKQMMTNVIFLYFNFIINSTIFFVALKHTIRNFINNSNNVEYWFDIFLNIMIDTFKNFKISVTTRNNIDSFVQTFIWNKNDIFIDKLYNQSNMSIFVIAANNFYEQYIA